MRDVFENEPERVKAVRALSNFPYFILNKEDNTTRYRNDLIRIKENYIMYKKGVDFYTEGSGGDYVPSNIRFKKIKSLLNKEARFMFSKTPDINIIEQNEADKEVIEQYGKIVKKVLKDSHFSSNLLKSAKDCFIGKRVAVLVDYDLEHGIMLHFYTALQFYYTYLKGTNILNKFVCFEKIENNQNIVEYLIYTYTLEDGNVYVEGALYDSLGVVKEQLIDKSVIGLSEIPAVIIFNDGTLEDKEGVSEIEDLEEFERGFSVMINCDIDSVKKGMNPIRYTVDMNSKTTKNLSSSAGSYWDLKSEQNQEHVHPLVGVLAPALNHTEPLKATLDRLNNAMHEALDVPDINSETLSGVITSGKALEALYYPLSVRCDEKLMTWKPAIERMIRHIIDLSIVYERKSKELYVLSVLKNVQYDVDVQENYALLGNVQEEMAIDLDEVAQNARSKKSYIKKWRSEEITTDKKAEDELMQIAVEQNMFDTTSINTSVQTELDKKASDKDIEESIEDINSNDIIDSDIEVVKDEEGE